MSKAAFSILLLLLFPAAVCAQDVPFSFRGISLGITASEFRTMPHPDAVLQKEPTIGLCSGDPLPKGYSFFLRDLSGSEETKRAGIGRCAFFRKSRGKLYETSIGIQGRGEASFLFFSEGKGAEPRLFSIIVDFPEKLFPDVAEGLKEKYGSPGSDTTGEVQNRFGAKFSSTAQQWKSAIGTLTLVQRSGHVDHSSLVILHDELDTAATRALKNEKALKSHL